MLKGENFFESCRAKCTDSIQNQMCSTITVSDKVGIEILYSLRRETWSNCSSTLFGNMSARKLVSSDLRP
jgi:hypothetical protein